MKPEEMNGLDPSPEALVDYVRMCGVAEPEAWLQEQFGREWRLPPRPVDNVVVV